MAPNQSSLMYYSIHLPAGRKPTESAANGSNLDSFLEDKHKNTPPYQGIVSIVNYDYIVTE